MKRRYPKCLNALSIALLTVLAIGCGDINDPAGDLVAATSPGKGTNIGNPPAVEPDISVKMSAYVDESFIGGDGSRLRIPELGAIVSKMHFSIQDINFVDTGDGCATDNPPVSTGTTVFDLIENNEETVANSGQLDVTEISALRFSLVPIDRDSGAHVDDALAGKSLQISGRQDGQPFEIVQYGQQEICVPIKSDRLSQAVAQRSLHADVKIIVGFRVDANLPISQAEGGRVVDDEHEAIVFDWLSDAVDVYLDRNDNGVIDVRDKLISEPALTVSHAD